MPAVARRGLVPSLLALALAALLAAGGLAGGAPPASAEYDLSKAPRTSIVKGPSKVVRTKGKRARVAFRFRADDRRASFRCRVRGAGRKLSRFRSCESPLRYRLPATRKGRKYVFQVRARSRSGIAEQTPARHVFRVRRR